MGVHRARRRHALVRPPVSDGYAGNIEIIRSFVRLRRLLATPGEILTIVKELAETVALHDEQIQKIAGVLSQILAPAPQPPKPDRKLGFQTLAHK